MYIFTIVDCTVYDKVFDRYLLICFNILLKDMRSVKFILNQDDLSRRAITEKMQVRM